MWGSDECRVWGMWRRWNQPRLVQDVERHHSEINDSQDEGWRFEWQSPCSNIVPEVYVSNASFCVHIIHYFPLFCSYFYPSGSAPAEISLNLLITGLSHLTFSITVIIPHYLYLHFACRKRVRLFILTEKKWWENTDVCHFAPLSPPHCITWLHPL